MFKSRKLLSYKTKGFKTSDNFNCTVYLQQTNNLSKMKLIKCFIIVLIASLTDCHPVNMICIPRCNINITASEEICG